jgi:hypothetical protein
MNVPSFRLETLGRLIRRAVQAPRVPLRVNQGAARCRDHHRPPPSSPHEARHPTNFSQSAYPLLSKQPPSVLGMPSTSVLGRKCGSTQATAGGSPLTASSSSLRRRLSSAISCLCSSSRRCLRRRRDSSQRSVGVPRLRSFRRLRGPGFAGRSPSGDLALSLGSHCSGLSPVDDSTLTGSLSEGTHASIAELMLEAAAPAVKREPSPVRMSAGGCAASGGRHRRRPERAPERPARAPAG